MLGDDSSRVEILSSPLTASGGRPRLSFFNGSDPINEMDNSFNAVFSHKEVSIKCTEDEEPKKPHHSSRTCAQERFLLLE